MLGSVHSVTSMMLQMCDDTLELASHCSALSLLAMYTETTAGQSLEDDDSCDQRRALKAVAQLLTLATAAPTTIQRLTSRALLPGSQPHPSRPICELMH